MAKKNQIKIEEITKLMVYILGHKPYEFGLVPDRDGYVTIKEFLQAIHEEPGWGHIRQSHIHEVLMSKNGSLFQADNKIIRVTDRHWELNLDTKIQTIPKILFIGIRKKAHPVVIENGLRPKEAGFHILSNDKAFAKRIGMRKDNQPVLIEVLADKAQKEGTVFSSFGDLYLAKEIPARHIAGPPVSKALIKIREAQSKQRVGPPPHEFESGTFILDLDRDMDLSRREKGRKKKKSWKEDAKKIRRRKNLLP